MTTVFVIVDVQHKILSVMSTPEKTTNAFIQLTTGMQLLNIPTILLEQYPQDLGPTDSAIKAVMPNIRNLKRLVS